MEENIFEGAKFGDKFLTRDGSEGLFIQYIKQSLTNPYMKNYYLCTIKDKIDGTTEDWTYNSDGTGYDNRDYPKYDIVSRYKEPIDEEKLDIFAHCADSEFYKQQNRVPQNMDYYLGFKAGYCKAMEE